jgi:hypothetical protein
MNTSRTAGQPGDQRDGQPGGQCLRVEGFDHFGGWHCETASLRKVLRFHGVALSEEMLFGLGGGIGFMHWWAPNAGPPFVGGRNGAFPDFILRAGRGAGQRIEVLRAPNPERGYENLIAELRQGRPVICYGDIFFLPYFHASRHFGGHAFVVYGLDEVTGQVLISDRGRSHRVIMIDELARARGSMAPPFPAANAQLEIDINASAGPGEQQLREAIQTCCQAMIEPPSDNFGLPGLLTFADQLDRVVADAPAEDLLEILQSAYVDLEFAGTGGSAFRALYRTFLAEAQLLLDDPALAEALPLAGVAVAAWAELIDTLLPPLGPGLRELRDGLRAKERLFEEGTAEQVANASEICGQLTSVRSAAASEVARHRRELPELRRRLAEVHRIEMRLFTALSRV